MHTMTLGVGGWELKFSSCTQMECTPFGCTFINIILDLLYIKLRNVHPVGVHNKHW